MNEEVSLFSVEGVTARAKTFFPDLRHSPLKDAIRSAIPSLNRNIKAASNYKALAALLSRSDARPQVLILGGSIAGAGLDVLSQSGPLDLIESDITLGERTTLVCDAHEIPFEDASLDAVIAQAVLEHVLDPRRCVEEIHRVLKPEGLVYAETPFMQQVHAGRYDFTRFTHLGHRRLFRDFEEIDSGAVCGPGMALAWSYQYFLMSFARSRVSRGLLKHFAALTSFFLLYFDHFLIDRPGTLDAASGYYFLGRRSNRSLPDRELIQLYRGTTGI